MKPKLGDLWPGEWDFPPYDGVGIELIGRPQDGAEEFLLTLGEHGCHPDMGREIFDALAVGLEPRHTVKNDLDFVALHAALARQGVTLNIIRPWPYPQGWEPRIFGPWPDAFYEAVRARRRNRRAS